MNQLHVMDYIKEYLPDNYKRIFFWAELSETSVTAELYVITDIGELVNYREASQLLGYPRAEIDRLWLEVFFWLRTFRNRFNWRIIQFIFENNEFTSLKFTYDIPDYKYAEDSLRIWEYTVLGKSDRLHDDEIKAEMLKHPPGNPFKNLD